MTSRICLVVTAVAVLMAGAARGVGGDFYDRVEHGYADSNGVKIHYASLGSGPLVVMIHGFPDFWLSWRHQMEALSDHYRVVAIDQRGYNQSDKPQGVESYDMSLLVGDVAAVIRHLGEQRAVVVGHDWGGAVAWQFALARPEMTDKLIVLNLPHPLGMARELATNEEQQKNSAYARKFKNGSPEDADIFFGLPMKPETLSGWVRDPDARARYVEAFGRSDFAAMLNYYKQNYPEEPYDRRYEELLESPPPKVSVPVLMFHGLADTALHRKGLNDTWDWLGKDLTLVTVPGASHFVQQDAAELVSSTMEWWLLSRR